MASADAILSSQVASECVQINKYVASPVVQVQRQQSDGITASGSRSRQVKNNKEMSSNAAVSVKIVNKQQQQQQLNEPRFAVELDGLNCFETLVPR